jgi:hypothetical protein
MLASCFGGFIEGNQEVVVWLSAAVSLRGVNLKDDSVFVCADAVDGLKLNIDDDSVLTSDSGNPKNDLDALGSVLTSDTGTDPTAGAGGMLFVTTASSEPVGQNFLVFSSAS